MESGFALVSNGRTLILKLRLAGVLLACGALLPAAVGAAPTVPLNLYCCHVTPAGTTPSRQAVVCPTRNVGLSLPESAAMLLPFSPTTVQL